MAENNVVKTRRRKSPLFPIVQYKRDCTFCIEIFNQNNIMTEKELKSLAFQIKHIYAYNRRTVYPKNIYISNYLQIQDYLDKGHIKWDVNFLDTSVVENHKNIVFLSPDAPDVLESVDSDKIYVIGGLVDRNHKKGIVYSYCMEHNIQSYRLPLKENVNLCASPVLTVNQVFELLSIFAVSKNWKEAIEACIPQRKLVKENKE